MKQKLNSIFHNQWVKCDLSRYLDYESFLLFDVKTFAFYKLSQRKQCLQRLYKLTLTFSHIEDLTYSGRMQLLFKLLLYYRIQLFHSFYLSLEKIHKLKVYTFIYSCIFKKFASIFFIHNLKPKCNKQFIFQN